MRLNIVWVGAALALFGCGGDEQALGVPTPGTGGDAGADASAGSGGGVAGSGGGVAGSGGGVAGSGGGAGNGGSAGTWPTCHDAFHAFRPPGAVGLDGTCFSTNCAAECDAWAGADVVGLLDQCCEGTWQPEHGPALACCNCDPNAAAAYDALLACVLDQCPCEDGGDVQFAVWCDDERCEVDDCCREAAACHWWSECFSFSGCNAGCSDLACMAACVAEHPLGAQAFRKLEECAAITCCESDIPRPGPYIYKPGLAVRYTHRTECVRECTPGPGAATPHTDCVGGSLYGPSYGHAPGKLQAKAICTQCHTADLGESAGDNCWRCHDPSAGTHIAIHQGQSHRPSNDPARGPVNPDCAPCHDTNGLGSSAGCDCH